MEKKLNSRDAAHLHAVLKEVWEYADKEWDKRYPNLPNPILTQTFRHPDIQDVFFMQGREPLAKVNAKRKELGLSLITEKENKRITNLRGGRSKHNVLPANAFDIAFIEGSRAVWDKHLFDKFWTIVQEKSALVKWGGNFKSLIDLPHFEL